MVITDNIQPIESTMETQTRVHPQEIVARYVAAYQLLYKRPPRDLRLLTRDWVTVNGARMRLIEMVYLTRQLEKEYAAQWEVVNKHTLVQRLLKWFKQ